LLLLLLTLALEANMEASLLALAGAAVAAVALLSAANSSSLYPSLSPDSDRAADFAFVAAAAAGRLGGLSLSDAKGSSMPSSSTDTATTGSAAEDEAHRVSRVDEHNCCGVIHCSPLAALPSLTALSTVVHRFGCRLVCDARHHGG
jgi:hypothetical protein